MAKGKGGIAVILVFTLLAVTLLLWYQFGVSSLAATDVGVNLTGSVYNASYNASTKTTIVAISFNQYIIYLVAAFAVLIALMMLVLIATRRKKW